MEFSSSCSTFSVYSWIIFMLGVLHVYQFAPPCLLFLSVFSQVVLCFDRACKIYQIQELDRLLVTLSLSRMGHPSFSRWALVGGLWSQSEAVNLQSHLSKAPSAVHLGLSGFSTKDSVLSLESLPPVGPSSNLCLRQLLKNFTLLSGGFLLRFLRSFSCMDPVFYQDP